MTTAEQKTLDTLSVELAGFIESMSGMTPRQSPLKSAGVQTQEHAEAIKRGLERLQQRIALGVDYLMKSGLFTKKDLGSLTCTDIVNGTIGEENPSKMPQDLLKISDEEMLHAYEHATTLYKEEKFEEAGNIFSVLSLLNPAVPAFWIGLGLCEERSDLYPSAAVSYLMAAHVSIEDSMPALQSAKCFIHSNETAIAKQILLDIIEKDRHDDVHRESQRLFSAHFIPKTSS